MGRLIMSSKGLERSLKHADHIEVDTYESQHHSLANAFHSSYSCCVYNGMDQQRCLAIDSECITEFQSRQWLLNSIAVLCFFVIIVLFLFFSTIVYCVRKRFKKATPPTDLRTSADTDTKRRIFSGLVAEGKGQEIFQHHMAGLGLSQSGVNIKLNTSSSVVSSSSPGLLGSLNGSLNSTEPLEQRLNKQIISPFKQNLLSGSKTHNTENLQQEIQAGQKETLPGKSNHPRKIKSTK
jgi:hypothetical protein